MVISFFDPEPNATTFKDLFSNLTSNLVAKLPNPSNNFGKYIVENYYKDNLYFDIPSGMCYKR